MRPRPRCSPKLSRQPLMPRSSGRVRPGYCYHAIRNRRSGRRSISPTPRTSPCTRSEVRHMNPTQKIPLVRRCVPAMALGALVCSGPTIAQEWSPSKIVRIVVPIVGSTNDVLARLVAPELRNALGQPVIVENKGGAGGTIGTLDVVKSAPDGHTLLVGYNGPIAINPTLLPKISYDVTKDLRPITLAVMSPQFLALNPQVPANNMKEFVALAKQRNLSYASVSPGSASHLTMEMLKAAAGIDITHVPYKGAAPA